MAASSRNAMALDLIAGLTRRLHSVEHNKPVFVAWKQLSVNAPSVRSASGTPVSSGAGIVLLAPSYASVEPASLRTVSLCGIIPKRDTAMIQPLKQLIQRASQLPVAIQNQLARRWLKDIEAQQRNETHQDEEPFESAYDAGKHLAGVIEGPGDLSTNPKYMEDFGKSSMQ
jgi:hypothetical protein